MFRQNKSRTLYTSKQPKRRNSEPGEIHKQQGYARWRGNPASSPSIRIWPLVGTTKIMRIPPYYPAIPTEPEKSMIKNGTTGIRWTSTPYERRKTNTDRMYLNSRTINPNKEYPS
ncbi:hypothetical protein VTN49DRAFT_7465 [Thermomyces lanuginosus]|uniref:uncharacterized protein n=1 Tax=Thermomyces lanuginosus TaxID=5541 RepID=UPI0037430930